MQALTRLSGDDRSQMIVCQRLFVQSQGKARQKQRMTTTISVMRLHANGCTWCVCIPIFLSSFLLLPPYNPLLLSIYLSISLPWNRQAISCPHAKMVRQLRQLKITTKCFAKVLSPCNPLFPKLYCQPAEQTVTSIFRQVFIGWI